MQAGRLVRFSRRGLMPKDRIRRHSAGRSLSGLRRQPFASRPTRRHPDRLYNKMCLGSRVETPDGGAGMPDEPLLVLRPVFVPLQYVVWGTLFSATASLVPGLLAFRLADAGGWAF